MNTDRLKVTELNKVLSLFLSFPFSLGSSPRSHTSAPWVDAPTRLWFSYLNGSKLPLGLLFRKSLKRTLEQIHLICMSISTKDMTKLSLYCSRHAERSVSVCVNFSLYVAGPHHRYTNRAQFYEYVEEHKDHICMQSDFQVGCECNIYILYTTSHPISPIFSYIKKTTYLSCRNWVSGGLLLQAHNISFCLCFTEETTASVISFLF